jgi:hypothetical protein
MIVASIYGETMQQKKSKEFYSEIDQIAEGFKEIKNPRTIDNQSYSLIHLLVMIICAILAGANTITEIHIYARINLRCSIVCLG